MAARKVATKKKGKARRDGGRRAAATFLEETRALAADDGDDPFDVWGEWFQRLARLDGQAATAASLVVARLALRECEADARDEWSDALARAWAAVGSASPAPLEGLPDEDDWDHHASLAGDERAPTATAGVVGTLFALRRKRFDVDLAATVAAGAEFALEGPGRRPRPAGRDLRAAIARSLGAWLRGEAPAPETPALPAAYGREPAPRAPVKPAPPTRDAAALAARVKAGDLSLEAIERAARLGHEPAQAGLRIVSKSAARRAADDTYAPDALIMWRFLGAQVSAAAASALARAVLPRVGPSAAALRRGLDALDAWAEAPSTATADAAYRAIPERLRERAGIPYHLEQDEAPDEGSRSLQATRAALAANLIAARMLQVHLARDDWAGFRRRNPGARRVTLKTWCWNLERWACDEPVRQVCFKADPLLTAAEQARLADAAREVALGRLLGAR